MLDSVNVSVVRVVRLGLILVPLLLAIALLARHPRPSPAVTTARAVGAAAPSRPHSLPNIARPTLLPVDPDFVAASRMMISPPPDTDNALRDIDPRRLRRSFARAKAMLTATSDEQNIAGAHLVNVAAVLGYEPARALIARDYPTSHIIRTAVAAPEAVRFSLDPILRGHSDNDSAFMALLAAYFAGRDQLAAYATYLLDAFADDRRLQSADSIKSLLTELARVPAVCIAIAHTLVHARTVTGPPCSSGLQLQMQNYLNKTQPPGLEPQSRRLALALLQNEKLIRQSSRFSIRSKRTH